MNRCILQALLPSILWGGALHAQVSLTDLVASAPTVFDTGHTGPFDNRYSFDGPSDSHGQSFLPTTSGDLEFLYMAYNAGGIGSFKVYVDTAYAGGGATEITTDATAAGKVFTINLGVPQRHRHRSVCQSACELRHAHHRRAGLSVRNRRVSLGSRLRREDR